MLYIVILVLTALAVKFWRQSRRKAAEYAALEESVAQFMEELVEYERSVRLDELEQMVGAMKNTVDLKSIQPQLRGAAVWAQEIAVAALRKRYAFVKDLKTSKEDQNVSQ
jgi:hypothetical protein